MTARQHPRIPLPVIGIAAEVLAQVHTHASMDAAFFAAGAPDPVPDGSKLAKARLWLSNANAVADGRPLAVLGALLSEVFEGDVGSDPYGTVTQQREEQRARLNAVLARCSLRYESVGKISVVGSSPASRTLEQLLADRDWDAVNSEFDRALAKIESEPAEAVSAACNIVESLLKTYLEDEGHALPAKKDVGGLWDAAKRHLGFDPAAMPDTDTKTIVGGLATVAAGIGALRTHASSAHGQGRNVYRLAPRHARLAVNAAHTIATFVIETWDTRASRPSRGRDVS